MMQRSDRAELVLLAGRHTIVPQVIESEFGCGPVGNVAFIHLASLGGWHVILNTSHRQTKVLKRAPIQWESLKAK